MRLISIATSSRMLGYLAATMSALALVALAWGLRADHLRAVYKSKWEAVSAEYAVFRTAIIDKTATALAAQKAVTAAKEQEWKDKADAADKTHEQALGDALARADRYIAANRVLRQAAGGSATGGACAAAQDHDTEGAGGPGGETELVAVSAKDVRVCTINTERLDKAHKWAVSLENEQ